jgi:hypothetical protein
MGRCSGFAFAQVATGDLDIAVIGQLPTANLPLGDQFEPGSVKTVGFKAAFGRGGLWKQDLEKAPGNPHYAFILAHPDAELDGVPVGVPPGVRRKAEEHEPLGRSANVHTDMPRTHRGVEPTEAGQCSRCRSWLRASANYTPGALISTSIIRASTPALQPVRAMIVERVKAGLSRARSQGKRLGRRPATEDVVERIREQLASGAGILKQSRPNGGRMIKQLVTIEANGNGLNYVTGLDMPGHRDICTCMTVVKSRAISVSMTKYYATGSKKNRSVEANAHGAEGVGT